MMNEIGENVKKLMLLGIGAVAATAEKSKEVVDELVKKGELTVEQGKTLNEELKHNIKQKVKESVNVEVVKEADTNDILNNQQCRSKSQAQLAQPRRSLNVTKRLPLRHIPNIAFTC